MAARSPREPPGPSSRPTSRPPRAAKPARAPLGWREWVQLPDLGIPWIKAKLDTGARTSALHALLIRILSPKKAGGPKRVRFEVPLDRGEDAPTVKVEADLLDQRFVRSSSGHAERRAVVLTRVRVGGEIWEMELTLARRDDMGFQLLLGREALRRRFVVDPGRSFVTGQPVDRDDPDSALDRGHHRRKKKRKRRRKEDERARSG